MSITTFAKLITTTTSKKIYLAELEPSENLTSWTLHSGSIYYCDIDTVEVQSVIEDTTTLTEVDSIAGISAGKWYHGKKKIYMQSTSGTPYANVIVANYKLYIATENIILNNIFYVGHLLSVPVIKQQKSEIYWGVSVISSGEILISNNGEYDEKYKNYSWSNKSITILMGGEDLAYSEYAAQFGGLITEKTLSTSIFKIRFKDSKANLEDTIPKNSFTVTDYPNLNAEDEGKPIPLVYGTVLKIPVVCTTLALGTATSLHSFKILDTSICTVNTISQVYINDIAVSHSSGSISDASFKLATATFSPGDSVTVSVIAAKDNPIEQLKHIASNVLSIPYNSTNYDTATVSLAVTAADSFPCGLAITESESALKVFGDLMQSCMGSLYVNNSGKYAVKIWDPQVSTDLTNIDFNDIEEGTFLAKTKIDDIRKTVRIGWAKKWANDSYAYKQLSSDTTEKIYGITKSKTINTLQSTAAGVDILLGRLGMIYESETVSIELTIKIQLAEKNIGDRIQISFKRQSADGNFSWVDFSAYEINNINKDFLNSKIRVIVDDLKGIGESVGHWTEDAPTFPYYLGGGSMTPWDSSWSDAQVNYAKAHCGYWTDADGFADPNDFRSLGASRWW